MSDWKQVVTEFAVFAADVGLAWLFFRLYKSKCASADHIKGLEPLNLSSLGSLDSPIEYGLVEGAAHAISRPLNSQYTNDEGPIKYFKRVLHKSERNRGYWSDKNKTLSENHERVPFGLFDEGKLHYIRVCEPSSAGYLDESLHTTHDHFEPTIRSVIELAFDRLMGDVNKGVQTTEQILRNGTAMIGLGKIVMKKGTAELKKPDIKEYILTTMTKEELVAYLKSRAIVYKIMFGIFSVAGVMILWVTGGRRIRQWIGEYRSQMAMRRMRDEIARMRELQPEEEAAAAEAVSSTSSKSPSVAENNTCVICLVNGREIANRPCGHVCSCLTCYEAMPSPPLCPVCRTPVTEIIPIYIS